MNTARQTLYVRFNTEICTACTDCVRICPTHAVRIRNEMPEIRSEQCIGCGECIRICPVGAVTTSTAELKNLDKDHISVALVSPVLYTQFPDFTPKEVLDGLRCMGFHHAVDMSYFLEMFQFATEEYISQNRLENNSPWPLISPICPVVIRLIACKFPSLLSNVLPLSRPVTLMAREVNRLLKEKYQSTNKNFTLYYVVPCPTKKEPSRVSYLKDDSYFVKAVGLNDIYADLNCILQKKCQTPLEPDFFEYHTTPDSVIWGISGGEIAELNNDRSLAVSGLEETISYLEKIEMGLFPDMEYIEFRTCKEGCIGGILTVIDRYIAKRGVQKKVLQSGIQRRVTREEYQQFYREGWFVKKDRHEAMRKIFGITDAPLSLEALAEIDRLVNLIRGKNCAACGSPGCRSFAEDVVRGNASLESCLEIRARKDRDVSPACPLPEDS